MPPPAPRVCFGRDELIEEIVGLAENLQPIALTGAGGIGKTSIALKVLHNNRIKQRFGENRRFIRCDQFPATLPHFLTRLSKVTGAGVKNPEDLTPLLPFLSSTESLIVLDNAESILDSQGTDSQAIDASVEELCQLDTICVCITSRISTIPPDCETFDIPTLSMDAARDVFYRLYRSRGRSDSVDGVLKQLEFHPLSVTLFATVAQQNKWGIERLVKEWEGRRTDTLQTEHRTSLRATIELSLTSPMFKELGPNTRGLLDVVAFYPQGVDENNIDWLFPTISDRTRILDKFCILSLTYRSNGFITMLAPLRDHFRPKDPMSSPLLCMTKEYYFARMSVDLTDPNLPGFGDSRWIISEDVNAEHLINDFTSVNPDSGDTWSACINFMAHIVWHKPRPTVLRKKIEGLPDDHRFKPSCLSALALLYGMFGNFAERALFLDHALRFERKRGDDNRIALTLRELSDANRWLGHYKEGMNQAREALEIFERLGKTMERAECLSCLSWLLKDDGQLDAAEEATLESIKLLPEKGQEYRLYSSHTTLGQIYQAKGEKEKAIYHYELALGIASTFEWHPSRLAVHASLVLLFLDEGELDNAQAHLNQTKSYPFDNPYYLGCTTISQACIRYKQRRFEDAASEALHAQGIFKKLGNLNGFERSGALLRQIEEAMKSLPPSGESDIDGELLKAIASLSPVNSFLSPRRMIQRLGEYSS